MASTIIECSRLQTAIETCDSVEELIEVVMNQEWPNDRV